MDVVSYTCQPYVSDNGRHDGEDAAQDEEDVAHLSLRGRHWFFLDVGFEHRLQEAHAALEQHVVHVREPDGRKLKKKTCTDAFIVQSVRSYSGTLSPCVQYLHAPSPLLALAYQEHVQHHQAGHCGEAD